MRFFDHISQPGIVEEMRYKEGKRRGDAFLGGERSKEDRKERGSEKSEPQPARR